MVNMISDLKLSRIATFIGFACVGVAAFVDKPLSEFATGALAIIGLLFGVVGYLCERHHNRSDKHTRKRHTAELAAEHERFRLRALRDSNPWPSDP